jgi:ABC-2 type transport system ATP-binding protein
VSIVEACGLGKRFGRTWALRDCTMAIPGGHVVALVGPNGAGKTTLLNLAAGLLSPTEGSLVVLGSERPGSGPARNQIGFVAQDAPLYGYLPVGDMLRVAQNLNLTWDDAKARAQLAHLGIPLDRAIRHLSGGQRAQLALTIAVAKRPELLILDEPLAALDPLARHNLLSSLMATVAEDGLSVIFSSHVVSELERIADYLVVLNEGQLQVAGQVDHLLARHKTWSGPSGEVPADLQQTAVIYARRAGAQAHLLVRTSGPEHPVPEGWQSHPASLEDLVLGYLRDPAAQMLPGPATATPAGGSAATK